MGTKFRTMLAPIGASTGDGRRFASGAITLAPTPFPFEWARSREMGHDGAVVVGAVQEATVATLADAVKGGWISAEAAQASGLPDDAEAVWARGELFDDVSREDMPRLAEDVAESMHLIQAGTLGPSVDLDSFEAMPVLEGTDEPLDWETLEAIYEETGEEPAIELLVTEGRVRAATLVSIPAFQETSSPLELIAEDGAEAAAVTASVTGATDLPIADTGTEWDGAAAARRVFDHFTDGDEVDTAGVARAFLYRDPDADAATQAAYKLGIADVVDGELTLIPRGVAAVAGGRGVDATEGIPDTEKSTIKTKVCTLYGKIRGEFEDWPECPFDDSGDSEAGARTVALIASVAAVELPPAAAFDMPALDGLTPITWDWENGRVFGHIAPWATCHVGYPDMCVTPPRDGDGAYSWFNRLAVDTADGGTIFTGRITVGGRHAGLALSASAAMGQYDGKTVAAHVRAYEDAHGIVVAGVIAPGLTASERAVLERRKVSGDWRETAAGLSLVEVLALSPGPRQHSEPGFPVETYSRGGRQVALTASYGFEGAHTRTPVVDVEAAVRRELDRREAAAALSVVLEGDRAAHRDDARQALAAALGGEV